MLIKRRYPLRSSEKKHLFRRITSGFNICIEDVGDKAAVEVAELRDGKNLVIIGGRPLFVELERELVPTLLFVELIERLPKVFVDKGAIPHICNGADIMAPGIVKIDGEFKDGELVAVLDEKHGKAIAIARALMSSESIKALKKGKVLKNVHYIGDSIWKIIKEI